MKKELSDIISEGLIKMAMEKSFVHGKIDPWIERISSSHKSDNERKQKIKELIDLGKFIYLFNQNIAIVDGFRERPDFTIAFENRVVGLELSDLVIRQDEKEKEGILKKMFEQIKNDLSKHDSQYKGIYSVGLPSNVDLSSAGRQLIKTEIRNIIDGKYSHGTVVNKVRKTPHTGIHLYCSQAHTVGSLNRSTVEASIMNKEKNIPNETSLFSEVWLVMVIGGAQTSEDYSYIEESVSDSIFVTKFNRIFLLNFFKSEIMELRTQAT